MIASFFKYLVIGIAAIFALKVAVGLVGIMFGLALIAVPCVLIGWVVYKVVGGKSSSSQISEADRKWLNS